MSAAIDAAQPSDARRCTLSAQVGAARRPRHRRRAGSFECTPPTPRACARSRRRQGGGRDDDGDGQRCRTTIIDRRRFGRRSRRSSRALRARRRRSTASRSALAVCGAGGLAHVAVALRRARAADRRAGEPEAFLEAQGLVRQRGSLDVEEASPSRARRRLGGSEWQAAVTDLLKSSRRGLTRRSRRARTSSR